jgi:DNA-binding response OmpR family regulator
MSYVKSHIDDELTDLPLFSIPAYRDAPVRVLLIQDLDTETALFRSTLETITGETFDLVTATDARTGLYLIASGRFDVAVVAAVLGGESGMDVIRRADWLSTSSDTASLPRTHRTQTGKSRSSWRI